MSTIPRCVIMILLRVCVTFCIFVDALYMLYSLISPTQWEKILVVVLLCLKKGFGAYEKLCTGSPDFQFGDSRAIIHKPRIP